MKTVPKVLLIIFLSFAALVVLLVAAVHLFTDDGAYEVRIIPVRGEISAFGEASSQKIASQIESANKNPMVKAIIIEINSPGGTVVASEEIATAIENANKPTVAWLREVAASGGYWIASSTDKIIADPATITGSLGVSASYIQFAGLMEEYGVTYESIVSGKHKETGSPYTDLSPEGRALMQDKVNQIRNLFVTHVANTRNMTWAKADELATGEIFLGVEAKENGLVDELGGKEHAFNAAKKLAGIESARLTAPDDLGSTLERLFGASAYWFAKGLASKTPSIFTDLQNKNSILTA